MRLGKEHLQMVACGCQPVVLVERIRRHACEEYAPHKHAFLPTFHATGTRVREMFTLARQDMLPRNPGTTLELWQRPIPFSCGTRYQAPHSRALRRYRVACPNSCLQGTAAALETFVPCDVPGVVFLAATVAFLAGIQ